MLILNYNFHANKRICFCLRTFLPFCIIFKCLKNRVCFAFMIIISRRNFDLTFRQKGSKEIQIVENIFRSFVLKLYLHGHFFSIAQHRNGKLFAGTDFG